MGGAGRGSAGDPVAGGEGGGLGGPVHVEHARAGARRPALHHAGRCGLAACGGQAEQSEGAGQPGIGADIWLLGLLVHRGRGDRGGGGADRRHAQVPAAGDADQPDPALRLVRAGRGGDDPLRLPAAHRRQHAARDRARVSAGRSSIRRAAAIRCCGSTCSGSSAIPEVYIIFLPSVALDRDDRADLRAHADRRLRLDRARGGRHRLPELRAVGASHVHDRAAGHFARACSRRRRRRWRFPTGVQIFCFIATLAAGRVTRSVPMLFVFGGLAIFVLGGLTGVMVALAPFDFQAHDTFFVVGHLHYVLIGGAIFPIFAGLLLFLPAGQRQEALRAARARSPSGSCSSASTSPSCRCTSPGCAACRAACSRIRPSLGFDALNLVSTIGAFILGGGHRRRGRGTSFGPKRKQPLLRAQSVERRHARVAAGDARQAVGRPLDSGDRQPLSALGPAELRARRRRGPLLSARRRGGTARDARHLASIDAQAGCNACGCRARASSRCWPR